MKRYCESSTKTKYKVTIVESGREFVFSSRPEVHVACGISINFLTKLVKDSRKVPCDYYRVKSTGILFKVEAIFSYRLIARPVDEDLEPIGFSSCMKAVNVLKLSKRKFYDIMKKAVVGVEYPTPVHDGLGNEWYLTFYGEED